MIIVESSLEFANGAIVVNGHKNYRTLDDFKQELFNYLKNTTGKEISIDLIMGEDGNTLTTTDIDDLIVPLRLGFVFEGQHCASVYDIEQLLSCFYLMEDFDGDESRIGKTWGYWMLDLEIL